MALRIQKVEVFAAELRDQPGDMARVLGDIAASGGSVDCIIARRQPEKPGTGVAFISPGRGKKSQAGPGAAGLNRAQGVSTLRVEGDDRAGLGAELCRAIADQGLNMRGLSAAVLGGKFVAYFGFDNDQDADRAAAAMKAVKAPRAAKRATRA